MQSQATIIPLQLALLALICCTACSTKPRREVRERYANGKEEIVRTYYDTGDTSNYLLEEFHSNGSRRVRGEILGDTAHLASWYENGQMEAEWSEIRNLEHGNIRCWYPNGQLKKMNILFLGEEIGKRREWYEDGRLKYEATFEEGQQTGRTQFWSKTGRYVSRTYVNDTLEGPSIEIDSMGGQMVGEYVNGLEDGLWTLTDSSGKVISTTNYYQGEIVN